MSEKYSDNTFFFANYGCCIPTESYAWILVALFVTTVLVLLICMLTTATIRWMYKRRMRKRLHDLKRKILMDQLSAQEFEAKLNYMAQRNKSCRNDDGSREGPQPEKLTIFVDPAQKEAEKHLNSAKNKKKNSLQKPVVGGPSHGLIYDRDETPIAQSTLASQSNTNPKMRNENRWMYLPKSAQAKAPVKTPLPDDTTPIPTPQIPQIPQKAQAPLPLAQAPPPPPPPHLGSYYDLPPNITAPPKLKPSPPKNQVDMGGNSPITPLDPTDVSPEVTKKDALAPPTSSVPTSSGVSSGTLTSSGTTPTTYTTPPETTPSGTSDSSFTTPLTPSSNATSPGEGVKQDVQYGQDDIVSPLGAPAESVEPKNLENGDKRKDGAGGRSEWKYYNLESSKKKRGAITTMSTTNKSSTSNRRSRTGSWLFDSTGSNRFDSSGPPSGPSAKTNSTVSSSILKTDSSYYKTASVEQFPHGAFTFQSN
ncbi:hypothetical protein L5515_013110 [Caenorhabditis briggsae]|uniref:Uncharacterized protein n=1 Tax=Caenorhabditis briggsae TaxID=6238 RepID=A0AAE9EAE6_CAEBR|nr:hypothetical protein L5515_013110 [Caenorhabditis briggsae]